VTRLINQAGYRQKSSRAFSKMAPFATTNSAPNTSAECSLRPEPKLDETIRGAAFIALIGRLSTYEIRTHFIFYNVIRSLYQGLDVNIAAPEGRAKLETLIPFENYAALMEFGKAENFQNILAHVMFGLTREALIDTTFLYGHVHEVKSRYSAATTDGIIFAPSPLGADLFLWAHGRGDLNMNNLFDAHLALNSEVKLRITPGICSTRFALSIPRPCQAEGEATKKPTE
jgi:hypothetical protein